MKKTYQNPATIVVTMQPVTLLEGTQRKVGDPWQPNDPVLSRHHKTVWDDEEDEDEE